MSKDMIFRARALRQLPVLCEENGWKTAMGLEGDCGTGGSKSLIACRWSVLKKEADCEEKLLIFYYFSKNWLYLKALAPKELHIQKQSIGTIPPTFTQRSLTTRPPHFLHHHQTPQIILMNILTHRISQSLAFNQLTTSLYFFASKMQASSTQKTKDSAGRRLGVKVLGDQEVYPNDIIARQRGFKWKTGKNVIIGKDQTIHAKVEGIVKFRISNERKVSFYYVDVEPKVLPNRKHGPPCPYNYHPELFPERASRNHPQLLPLDAYHVKLG